MAILLQHSVFVHASEVAREQTFGQTTTLPDRNASER